MNMFEYIVNMFEYEKNIEMNMFKYRSEYI